jgi:hypothetical protein
MPGLRPVARGKCSRRCGDAVRVDRVPDRQFSRTVENMIAEIRGVPVDDSQSRRRDTRSLSELTEHLLHKHRIGMKTPEEAIRDAWTEIVGAPNAEYCHPLRIDRERVLLVGVSNPIVRQELLFHKAVVLQRIKAIPACAQITDVVFRAG